MTDAVARGEQSSGQSSGDREYAEFGPLFEELAATPPGAERERLRDKLVSGHLPLARHIAHRFANRGQPVEDLQQVAVLGLINAVDRFDPARARGFLPYAIPTIMGEVRRYFRDNAWSVRVPRRLKELHVSIGSMSATLYQKLGRAATPSELAEALDITVEEVYEGLEASHAYAAMSVDLPVDDASGFTLADMLGGEDPELEKVENFAALGPLLARLPARERKILSLRFQGNMTQSEIAHQVGLSQMQISRLLTQTLTQLRTALTADV